MKPRPRRSWGAHPDDSPRVPGSVNTLLGASAEVHPCRFAGPSHLICIRGTCVFLYSGIPYQLCSAPLLVLGKAALSAGHLRLVVCTLSQTAREGGPLSARLSRAVPGSSPGQPLAAPRFFSCPENSQSAGALQRGVGWGRGS